MEFLNINLVYHIEAPKLFSVYSILVSVSVSLVFGILCHERRQAPSLLDRIMDISPERAPTKEAARLLMEAERQRILEPPVRLSGSP
jgi:hypothetical protein